MRASDFLTEMDLKPGEVQQIEASLEKYQEKKQKLDDYRHFLMRQQGIKPYKADDQNVELIKKIDEVIAEIERMIERLTNELEATKKQSSLYALFERIEREASFAVKSFKNTQKVLYRGSRKSQDAFIGRPWTGRKPTHSNSEFSDLYDQALSMYGAKALRSNSLFVTADPDLAAGFGNVLHIIFPMDGFHYTWSTVEKDIVFNSESWSRSFDNELVADYMKALEPYWTDEAHEYYIENFIEMKMTKYTKEALFDPDNIGLRLGFFPNGLVLRQFQFIKHMLNNPETSNLKITNSKDLAFINEFTELRDFAGMYNIIENYGVKIDTDFEDALISKHEIMINGTYFAIKRKYLPEVKEWLGII
jgi:hypothetical protein